MSESNINSGGIGFSGLLAIAFVVLKLCGVIAWSWWWVTAPLWMPAAFILIGGTIFISAILISKNGVK